MTFKTDLGNSPTGANSASSTLKTTSAFGLAMGVALLIGMPAHQAQAACDYQTKLGSCKLTADIKADGLTVITNTNSCASVDYQINGRTQRMFLDQGKGVDPSITAASSGINVISCSTHPGQAGLAASGLGLSAAIQQPTMGQAIRTSERVVNANLIATGQRNVTVQVPVYERRVYVERQVPVEKKVYIEKPVYIERRVPVEKKVYVEKPVYIDRQVPVEKPVVIRQNVPVDRPVYVPYTVTPQMPRPSYAAPAYYQQQQAYVQPGYAQQQQAYVQPGYAQQAYTQQVYPTQATTQVTPSTVVPGIQAAGTIVNTVPLP